MKKLTAKIPNGLRVAKDARGNDLIGNNFGFDWAICKAPEHSRPALNGYVYIGEEHPWWNYEHLWEIPYENIGGASGLTYDRGGWVGFDTIHAFDYWPGQQDVLTGFVNPPEPPFEDAKEYVVWSPDLVVSAVLTLCAQARIAQLEG